jgi:F0F1-type ATP synthase assembly protein I
VTNDGAGEERNAGGAAESARRARRDLNNGAGDALTVAFELALTPALFAVAGWRLDLWLGTGPLFLVALFVFVMAYEIWKLFARYDARMRVEEQSMRLGRGQEKGA